MATLLRKSSSCWPLMPKIKAPFVEQRMSSIIERNMWGEKERRAARDSKEWWELSGLMILLFCKCVNKYPFSISNNINYYMICRTILNIIRSRSTSNEHWSWTPCGPDNTFSTIECLRYRRHSLKDDMSSPAERIMLYLCQLRHKKKQGEQTVSQWSSRLQFLMRTYLNTQ